MEYINYEVGNRVARITLNRPEKRNALSYDVVTELKEAFKMANENAEAKVIVLQAEGKVFCAGADLGYIQQLQNNTYEENLADSKHLAELFHYMYTMPKVIIAKVHGHAIAGGSGLATICDFVYTVPEAKFGYTEVRIGFIPAIVKVFLLRKIGEGRAKELLLTGELISAETAERYGMVNRVVPADELSAAVDTLANNLCTLNSGQSMAYTKQMIANVPEMTLEGAIQYAAEQNATARGSADCKKGIGAFLAKEKISW